MDFERKPVKRRFKGGDWLFFLCVFWCSSVIWDVMLTDLGFALDLLALHQN